MTTMLFIQPSSEVHREAFNIYVGLEVLTAVVMNATIFWDKASCSPYVNRRFR
jgi:hypothetical protein